MILAGTSSYFYSKELGRKSVTEVTSSYFGFWKITNHTFVNSRERAMIRGTFQGTGAKMQPLLRPLSLGELLDQTFQFYRRHFLLFIGIAAVPQLFILLFQVAFQSIVRSMRGGGSIALSGIAIFVTAIVGLIVLMIASAVSQAATATAVSELYLGRETTIGATYGRIRGSLGRMTGIVFGLGLLIGIAFLCLIIPGIYVALIWSLAIPAAVIEDLGFAECRDRSKFLTEGARGRMFMIWVLVLFVTYIVILAIQVPVGAIGALVLGAHPGRSLTFAILSQITGSIASTLVGPLGMIAFTIAYFDQRVRKEAFDIQVMMQASQAAAAGSGSAS